MVKFMNIKSGNITRKKVVLILKNVIEESLTFDYAFSKALENQRSIKLQNKDKAFIYLLSSTVLRYLTQIDNTMDTLLKEPIRKLPSNPKMALRIGLAQMFVLKTPNHASVNTSVDLAGVKWRGLVNAVMRNITREEDKYKKIFNDSLKIPKWLLDRWKTNWPNDYLSFIDCIQDIHPHIDIAIKKDIEKWQKKLNAQLLPNDVLRIKESGLISEKEGYDNGQWWVQDYSSQIAVKAFKIKKNEEILDLCAAPGGKTAQMMAAGANVLSIDQSEIRIKKFKDNMQRLKFNAKILEIDILKYNPNRKWDKILLDAPCSSTGIIRKNPDILYSHSEKSIKNLCNIQKSLMEKSWSLLNKNGHLMYCNCSLEPEEGERLIEEFLDRHIDAKIIKFNSDDVENLNDSIKKEGWIRILPNDDKVVKNKDGFFIALIKKFK